MAVEGPGLKGPCSIVRRAYERLFVNVQSICIETSAVQKCQYHGVTIKNRAAGVEWSQQDPRRQAVCVVEREAKLEKWPSP